MIFKKNTRRKVGNAPKGNYAFRTRKKSAKPSFILEFNPETEASKKVMRSVKRRRGFRMAVILIACMALVALARLVVREAFINNDRFHLQDFSVLTEGPLTPDQIVSATGLHHGMNMLMISLAAVRDRLEALPEVRKARVSRDYPGMLNLEVEQRKPVAWLVTTGSPNAKSFRGCMLDADGVVLPDFKKGAGGAKLPRITLDVLPRMVPGRPVESVQVLAALHLLAAHQGTVLGQSLEIVSIDATRKYGLQASTGQGGLSIMFGVGEFDKQLRRLDRVVADAARRNRTLATVNLLVEQNVPVTFRDAGSTAATTTEKRQGSPGDTLASAGQR